MHIKLDDSVSKCIWFDSICSCQMMFLHTKHQRYNLFNVRVLKNFREVVMRLEDHIFLTCVLNNIPIVTILRDLADQATMDYNSRNTSFIGRPEKQFFACVLKGGNKLGYILQGIHISWHWYHHYPMLNILILYRLKKFLFHWNLWKLLLLELPLYHWTWDW